MARFSFFAQIFTQHSKDGAGTNPRGRKGLSNTDWQYLHFALLPQSDWLWLLNSDSALLAAYMAAYQ